MQTQPEYAEHTAKDALPGSRPKQEEHIDTALAGLGDYKVCYPFAAIQYNGYSDIQRAPTNYESMLIGKLIYE